MMLLVEYLITVVLVSSSGALAPGPLFFATLLNGTRGGARAGFLVSVGHTIVELPLVMLLAVGLIVTAGLAAVKMTLGLAGGVALIGFGSAQILQMFLGKHSSQLGRSKLLHNSILLGVILSALNPFFILWWFTVGSKLIFDALILASSAGVFIMYLAHVWIDFAWLTLIANLAKKGTNLLNTQVYRIILTVFGVALIYFGVVFLMSAIDFSISP